MNVAFCGSGLRTSLFPTLLDFCRTQCCGERLRWMSFIRWSGSNLQPAICVGLLPLTWLPRCANPEYNSHRKHSHARSSEYRTGIEIRRRRRNNHHNNQSTNGDMGFILISLYFVLTGLVGTLGIRLCYNKGPSTNMLNVVLVNTAVICCWLMWAIVWLAQWKPLINPVLKGEGE